MGDKRACARPDYTNPSHRLDVREKIRNTLKKLYTDPRNHPCYIDGRMGIEYPYEFDKDLKKEIKDRDNHTCQICGIKEEKYYRHLDIHHIDGNKRNTTKENLVALCNSCHVKLHAKTTAEYREVARLRRKALLDALVS
jgi:ribosomal protein L37AE/L43A